MLSAVENIDIGDQALLQKDEDIIILGDFNTMGDGGKDSAEEEIENFESIYQLESSGFLHLDIQPRCTEYYRGYGGWLDHILVSRFMEEITDFTAYVKDYCKIKSCADISGAMPAAYIKLSDHSPVVFVINDVDNDD